MKIVRLSINSIVALVFCSNRFNKVLLREVIVLVEPFFHSIVGIGTGTVILFASRGKEQPERVSTSLTKLIGKADQASKISHSPFT